MYTLDIVYIFLFLYLLISLSIRLFLTYRFCFASQFRYCYRLMGCHVPSFPFMSTASVWKSKVKCLGDLQPKNAVDT